MLRSLVYSGRKPLEVRVYKTINIIVLLLYLAFINRSEHLCVVKVKRIRSDEREDRRV